MSRSNRKTAYDLELFVVFRAFALVPRFFSFPDGSLIESASSCFCPDVEVLLPVRWLKSSFQNVEHSHLIQPDCRRSRFLLPLSISQPRHNISAVLWHASAVGAFDNGCCFLCVKTDQAHMNGADQPGYEQKWSDMNSEEEARHNATWYRTQ